MSDIRVIAFDGAPVTGGAAACAAILETTGEERLHTIDGRAIPRDRFGQLVAGGFVTRVSPRRARPDGVVVYRTRDVGPRSFDAAGIEWTPCDAPNETFEVTYLSKSQARAALELYARDMHRSATLALQERRRKDASWLARRGLMAVPGMRESEVASALYAVLLAANGYDGDALARLRREAALLLAPSLATHACDEGVRLMKPSATRRAPREFERALTPGTLKPPREAARRAE